MNNERYEDVKSSPDKSKYNFVSLGRHGAIEKFIEFNRVHPDLPDLYNLGFGHPIDNGMAINDNVRANNGDMMKILSTVAFTVIDFIRNHPDSVVYIRGSDSVRTRVYQIAINKHYDEIIRDYDLYGHVFIPATEIKKEQDYNEPFQKNKNYYGFFAIKNKLTIHKS